MFAIQPSPLPSAAQMLLAIVPAGEPATDAGFDAQFSALLASAVPSQAPALPAHAPARPALPGARGGKDEAANGKLPGKPGGNILPDAIAALAAPQGDAAEAETESEILPVAALDGIAPSPEVSATLTLQRVFTQLPAAAPARALAPPVVAAAPESPAPGTLAKPASAPADRQLAMASTAPAAATTAMPGAHSGGAALPPPAFDLAPDARIAGAAPLPDLAAKVAALAAPTIPALRIPLGIGQATALAPRQLPADAKAETPPQPSAVVLLPVLQAQAASLALGQHAGKTADPAAPLEVPVSQFTAQTGAELPSAGREVIAAAPQPLALSVTAPVAAAFATAVQPHDFAALVERLVEARQAVQSTLTNQTVQASVQHAEFGRVSLAFQQDASGMTVSFVGPDPELARAVQTFAPATISADIKTADSSASSQRQDGQGSASANSGQSQGQPQGQLSAQHQRGQSSQREAVFGSTAQDRQSGSDAESASDPRGGIFA